MRTEALRAQFVQQFGEEPSVFAVAPGRINLIGEHTDYNDGFVFPAAIDLDIMVAATKTEGPTELFSTRTGKGESFDARSTQPGEVGGWATYVAGVAWALGGGPNVKAVVDSTLPMASGVSSSAALELVFAVLWNHLAGLGLSQKDLALRGQRAENEYVGLPSGIMDQMASALGRAGHAIFLDTRTREVQYAPIPANLAVVMLDTGTPRNLTQSGYEQRVEECARASAALGVAKLRDASLAQLEEAMDRLDEVSYRRARHVIGENDRCAAFAEALERGDLAAVGRLMEGSHVSLRNDYEVSSNELDAMVAAARSAPGCVGARMTGAGFGGACVAFVEADRVPAFLEATQTGYRGATGLEGTLLPCLAADGARVLSH